MAVAIRPAVPSDFAALLALNEESVHFLSPLDETRLSRLWAESSLCVVTSEGEGGAVDGFLLALREGVAYDSPNYRWFAARYPTFLYVDRIVIAAAAQGRGRGRALYTELFRVAREMAVPFVTAEFDVEPPNEGSRRLHGAFGFAEVGRQTLAAGKVVSLQQATP